MGNKQRNLRALPQYPDLVLEPVAAKPVIKVPPHYQVFLSNDDYTPMNFVVEVLEKFFAMDHAFATTTMMQVHQRGKALCGSYTREIAETKVTQVNAYARTNEHPLLCSMEETQN